MAWLVQEVPDPSDNKFGCGSIVAMIIIALVIGLCGGFKSCKEDKKPKAVESRTEQPQRSDEVKVQSPPYVPNSSHPSASAPTSTTASKPQKEASAEPVTETSFNDDMEAKEPLVPTAAAENEDNTITESDSETPVLTEKERRKAERQAKREARRREKAQKNN